MRSSVDLADLADAVVALLTASDSDRALTVAEIRDRAATHPPPAEHQVRRVLATLVGAGRVRARKVPRGLVEQTPHGGYLYTREITVYDVVPGVG